MSTLMKNDKTIAGLVESDRGSVSVTADGTKTYATLLNELANAADLTKITKNSLVRIVTNGGEESVWNVTTFNAYGFRIAVISTSSGAIVTTCGQVYKTLSNCSMARTLVNSSGTTFQDQTSTAPSARTITLCY